MCSKFAFCFKHRNLQVLYHWYHLKLLSNKAIFSQYATANELKLLGSIVMFFGTISQMQPYVS